MLLNETLRCPRPLNYRTLQPVETWMAFFRGLSRAEKVEGFKRM